MPERDAGRLLRRLYKLLMSLAALALLAAAGVAYRAATPGSGLVLLALLLGVLALIAFFSIDKLDRREQAARVYREIWQDLRRKVTVTTVHAPPVVHVVDRDGIARARQLRRDGATLDAICRAIASDYPAWTPQEQEAFQDVMRAVLERSEAAE